MGEFPVTWTFLSLKKKPKIHQTRPLKKHLLSWRILKLGNCLWENTDLNSHSFHKIYPWWTNQFSSILTLSFRVEVLPINLQWFTRWSILVSCHIQGHPNHYTEQGSFLHQQILAAKAEFVYYLTYCSTGNCYEEKEGMSGFSDSYFTVFRCGDFDTCHYIIVMSALMLYCRFQAIQLWSIILSKLHCLSRCGKVAWHLPPGWREIVN